MAAWADLRARHDDAVTRESVGQGLARRLAGESRMKSLANIELLILDDWGLQPLDAQARHDLLEFLENRYGRKSTIVTSQLPVSPWHHAIADATSADAILDRLVHNTQRVELDGDSLRRTKAERQVDDSIKD